MLRITHINLPDKSNFITVKSYQCPGRVFPHQCCKTVNEIRVKILPGQSFHQVNGNSRRHRLLVNAKGGAGIKAVCNGNYFAKSVKFRLLSPFRVTFPVIAEMMPEHCPGNTWRESGHFFNYFYAVLRMLFDFVEFDNRKFAGLINNGFGYHGFTDIMQKSG